MSTAYLAKRESPMLNSLRYGMSLYMPLDVEQIEFCFGDDALTV